MAAPSAFAGETAGRAEGEDYFNKEEISMKPNQLPQERIRLGAHGEDYGSWMSNPVFYIVGGMAVLAAFMAALSFLVFRLFVLGILFSVAAAAMLALLLWIA